MAVEGDGVPKRGASARIGDRRGRRGFGPDITSWSSDGEDCEAAPNPRPLGRALGGGCSSRSALSTRPHMCLQISSDSLGPGSPSSSAMDPERMLALAAGEVLIRYRMRPTVLGSAYSFAMAESWLCKVG